MTANRSRAIAPLTALLAAAALLLTSPSAQADGPIILDLGPVKPTPAPTPESADRKRLISTITVKNNVRGESIISFEASDVADQGPEKAERLMAVKTYTLSEDALKDVPDSQYLAESIERQIRALEREMLEYVELVGPPKERAPITD